MFFWVRVEGAVGVVMERVVPSASPGHMDACGAGVPVLNYLSIIYPKSPRRLEENKT